MRSVLVLIVAALALTACAYQPPQSLAQEPPGFLLGLWHGVIVLFSLVASLFSDVRVYAYPNGGFWYDLGFFIGLTISLGGAGGGASRAKRR